MADIQFLKSSLRFRRRIANYNAPITGRKFWRTRGVPNLFSRPQRSLLRRALPLRTADPRRPRGNTGKEKKKGAERPGSLSFFSLPLASKRIRSTAMTSRRAIHFQPHLVNRVAGQRNEFLEGRAINISVYGRLEEFRESSETRDPELPAKSNEIGLGAGPRGLHGVVRRCLR